ncbi:lytic polysaccharide monooxygenase auxiliary activity family 9 protein [Streptomyces sp. NBC_01429]|uniref:lytic polysaccharide monooxygenase auxiliary activity family 9 protein n=1 Tax=Streptomyces sp. NBC_01429 TaxID=2903862 RepID=UPI002E2C62CB|nr:lytic polysaccharide monooxygenase [Streptomyces sp. NBC_01429]
MTPRRTAIGIVTLGLAPLALAGLAATPAAAHGSMTDPVSRVAACFAEGPESPQSAACKAAVAASGTQAFYDWNEVNIADAAGNHRQIIPDGKLCSAGRDKYKGLDLARGDWPSSAMTSGNRTFRYKATAPHKGSFELYVTKDGYDPATPLKWSDLEEKPFLTVADPKLEDGAYVFNGVVPNKSGRHLIYSVWQRSDSPEAFYTCSDVVFGQDNGGAGGAAPAASAPTDQKIEDGTDKSTVDHNGHGGDGKAAGTDTAQAPAKAEAGTEAAGTPADTATDPGTTAPNAPEAKAAGTPVARGDEQPAAAQENLAETGGSGTTPYLAVGGAAALALGAAVMFGTARRKAVATPGGRRGR